MVNYANYFTTFLFRFQYLCFIFGIVGLIVSFFLGRWTVKPEVDIPHKGQTSAQTLLQQIDTRSKYIHVYLLIAFGSCIHLYTMDPETVAGSKPVRVEILSRSSHSSSLRVTGRKKQESIIERNDSIKLDEIYHNRCKINA